MTAARLGRILAYLASFGLGRGALFGAPLLIASLLPASDYGRIETAQAAATLAAGLAVLGTASLVPLVMLRGESRFGLAPILLHHLAMAAVCGGVALLAALGGAYGLGLTALFAAAIALQSLASTQLKTLGRPGASILVDAGLFVLMALVAIAARLAAARTPLAWIAVCVTAYTAGLAAFFARALRARPAAPGGAAAAWGAAIAAGVPLMLGSAVSLLATTSGRLGMGLLAGPVATADYAVLARAAALPIVAHQVTLIAAYRDLFTHGEAESDRVAARVVMLVAASALAFCLLLRWLGPWLGPAFVSAFARFPHACGWIVAQSVLWSAIALNDLAITRAQAMPRVLPASAGCMVVALTTGWLVLNKMGVDLEHFVYVHAAVMTTFFVVQSTAMRANAIRRERTWATAIGAYAVLIALAIVLPQAV